MTTTETELGRSEQGDFEVQHIAESSVEHTSMWRRFGTVAVHAFGFREVPDYRSDHYVAKYASEQLKKEVINPYSLRFKDA